MSCWCEVLAASVGYQRWWRLELVLRSGAGMSWWGEVAVT